MIFNGVEITHHSIIATRQHFADISQHQIDEALDGTYPPASHVNIGDYIAMLEQEKVADLRGANDHTFTFAQRAYWIQTGESVALLP